MQKLKITAMALAQQFMKELGIQPPGEEGGQGGKGGGGGKHGGGRPPSGARGPRLKEKGGAGGEPRTVISESG